MGVIPVKIQFHLEVCTRHKIEKADGLNRRPDWKVGIENNNSNQVFIKEHWICNLYEVVVEESEVDIVEKIKKARGKEKEIVRVVEEIKKAGMRNLRKDK